MGPKTAQLVETLAEIGALLRSDGNEFWSDFVDECRGLLVASDYFGVDRLLSAYGGMGSFNDVVVGFMPATGTWKPEAKSSNEKLNALRSRAYNLAQEIRRANHGEGN